LKEILQFSTLNEKQYAVAFTSVQNALNLPNLRVLSWNQLGILYGSSGMIPFVKELFSVFCEKGIKRLGGKSDGFECPEARFAVFFVCCQTVKVEFIYFLSFTFLKKRNVKESIID
jgi:hypothetical protein